jgi:hypothetical protein
MDAPEASFPIDLTKRTQIGSADRGAAKEKTGVTVFLDANMGSPNEANPG